jgi:hypothetical protein
MTTKFSDPYLPDCTDFTNIPVLKKPSKYRKMVKCPKCKGHGHFNLRLNAYGPGKHFQGTCSQCCGCGWVDPKDAICIHEWKEIGREECRKRGVYHAGNCYHVYVCSKLGCAAVMAQDSSD